MASSEVFCDIFNYRLLLPIAIIKLLSSKYLIFTVYRDWLKKALTLCGPEHIEELQLRKLGSEIDKLSLRLSARVEMNGIGFCHNDLQYGNIMLDEEDSSITLIVSSIHL